jgi:hypothetical protein
MADGEGQKHQCILHSEHQRQDRDCDGIFTNSRGIGPADQQGVRKTGTADHDLIADRQPQRAAGGRPVRMRKRVGRTAPPVFRRPP